MDYIKEKMDELLSNKLKEQGIDTGSGSSGGGGSSGTGSSGSVGKTQSIIDELEGFVKEQYNTAKTERPTLPDTPEYERMDTNFDSDEDIVKKAESALSDYANQTQSGIEDEISALAAKLNADKESAASGYASIESALERIYGDAKEGASNDMLKRGLARSSISASVVAGLEKELGEKRSAALNEYISGIQAIESEIAGLEGKRQKALNDFNIAYAAKLTEQINSLTEKRDDNVKEALKYNNSLTEKEHAEAVQKELDESKLYTEQLTQSQKEKDAGSLTKAQQERIYESTYEKMDELLSKLPASEAKDLVKNNVFFLNNLNSYYYYKLLDKYTR